MYTVVYGVRIHRPGYTGVQQNNLLLAGAKFYMNNDLAEPYRPGKI
jgi:hypothetical protein